MKLPPKASAQFTKKKKKLQSGKGAGGIRADAKNKARSEERKHKLWPKRNDTNVKKVNQEHCITNSRKLNDFSPYIAERHEP